MGTKRDYSPKNVLFGWLMKKRSMKVMIILGAFLFLCALVAVKLTLKHPSYFYIASESIHSAGIIVLIYKLFSLKTCSGLSLKTQELTALYLATRLSFSTLVEGDIYTVLDFISFLSTLVVIWVMRFKLKSSYVKEFDTLRRSFVVVPTVILAILIHPDSGYFPVHRVVWSFSVYLEAISVLPQLRFMQNAKMVETFTGYYIFALGISRFLQLAHWLIQIYVTRGSYFFLIESSKLWLITAFFSEMVHSFILADFCYYYMKSFIQGQLLRKMPI